MQRFTAIGNVGKDPEIKRFDGGGEIASFSVGVSEKWKDKKTGEKKEKTEWINVSVSISALVAVVLQWVRKGSKVYIEGKLTTRSWEDKNGEKKYITEISLLSIEILSFVDGVGSSEYKKPSQPQAQKTSIPKRYSEDLDDDIPF